MRLLLCVLASIAVISGSQSAALTVNHVNTTQMLLHSGKVQLSSSNYTTGSVGLEFGAGSIFIEDICFSPFGNEGRYCGSEKSVMSIFVDNKHNSFSWSSLSGSVQSVSGTSTEILFSVALDSVARRSWFKWWEPPHDLLDVFLFNTVLLQISNFVSVTELSNGGFVYFSDPSSSLSVSVVGVLVPTPHSSILLTAAIGLAAASAALIKGRRKI